MDRTAALVLTLEQISFVTAALLFLPALAGLLWFTLGRFTRRWQREFVTQAAHIRRRLSHIEANLAWLSGESRGFSSGDPEPYGPPAAELEQGLARMRQLLKDRADHLSDLDQNSPGRAQEWPSRLLHRFWTEPRHWQQRYKAAERAWQMTQELQHRVDHAGQLLRTLQRLPVEVAGRSRDLFRVSDDLASLIQTLYAAGLQGQALDAAADSARQMEDRLRGLPVCFFQEDEALILDQADKQSTIQAWQTLAEIEGPLRRHGKQFQRWQAAYRELGQQVQRMRQAAETAQYRLQQAPAELDFSTHLLELEQAETEADELEARVRAPTVEALNDLSARVLGIIDVLSWLTSQADSLSEKLRRLQSLIVFCADLLAQTQARMTEAARAEVYPLAWPEWQGELADLSRFKVDIGPPGRRRTPADLERHLALAEQWSARGQTLREKVNEVLFWREKLLALLQVPELAAVPDWFSQAEQLDQQVSRYAAKNWPREDAAGTIWDQAEELAERKRLLTSGAAEPLPAEEMEPVLNQAQALVAEIEDFKARLKRIAETLESLQIQEQEARRELTGRLRAVEHLVKQMSRARFLGESPLRKYSKQLDNLRREGHKLLAKLNKQDTGTVAEKARQAGEWTNSGLGLFQEIRQELELELKKLAHQLEQELKTLQATAPLERERCMRMARQSLEAEKLPPTGQQAGSGHSQPERLIEQIEDLLNRTGNIHHSLQTLLQQASERIAPRVEKMNGVQQQAQAVVKKLEQNVDESRWPPVACNLKPINQLLQQAGQELARLKQSGDTVKDVTLTLEAVTRYYESAHDKAAQALAGLMEQRTQLETILDQVEQRQRRLELYRAYHREDAALVKAVNERLNLIAEKKAEARRPQLSPEQVRRLLEDLGQATSEDLRVQRDSKTDLISADQIR